MTLTAPIAHGRSHGPWRRAARRFAGHRAALASLVFLTLLCALVLTAPAIGSALGVDGQTVNLLGRLLPPDSTHLLGTDELGRDVLMRLLAGGRISLAVGLAAALVAACVGTGLGLMAGYLGGTLDAFLMRLTDTMIALPALPFLIILSAIDPAKLGFPVAIVGSEHLSVYRVVLLVALFGWTTVARLVRASALTLRVQPFVLAARAEGAGPFRIMRLHILPNLLSPVIVATTLAAGQIILLESVLSFLGLGIQPPTPSWGNLLTNAQELIWTAPQLAIWPGALIFATVIAFNFVGDGLQDALDPRAEDTSR
jgi:peptide/nickel transport system permease protein